MPGARNTKGNRRHGLEQAPAEAAVWSTPPYFYSLPWTGQRQTAQYLPPDASGVNTKFRGAWECAQGRPRGAHTQRQTGTGSS